MSLRLMTPSCGLWTQRARFSSFPWWQNQFLGYLMMVLIAEVTQHQIRWEDSHEQWVDKNLEAGSTTCFKVQSWHLPKETGQPVSGWYSNWVPHQYKSSELLVNQSGQFWWQDDWEDDGLLRRPTVLCEIRIFVGAGTLHIPKDLTLWQVREWEGKACRKIHSGFGWSQPETFCT
jgi:hypothetical protein